MPDTMTLVQEDFLQAIKAINPSVLRSVEVESPAIAWEDIGGLEAIKQTLQESVEGALLYLELYAQTGAKAPEGYCCGSRPEPAKRSWPRR